MEWIVTQFESMVIDPTPYQWERQAWSEILADNPQQRESQTFGGGILRLKRKKKVGGGGGGGDGGYERKKRGTLLATNIHRWWGEYCSIVDVQD